MALNGLTEWNTSLRIADLKGTRTHRFTIVPDAEHMNALAEELDISALRKMRFSGEIRPFGKSDWEIVATLGATVVQPCVATLAPVTTRIETPVERRYLAELNEEIDEDSDVEMPEDDTIEPLPATLNLSDLAAEALALALPDYPRADDGAPVSLQVTEAGKEAMTDADAKPFAALKALRDKLGKDG
ncbi:YceD family protein [Celeribacter arenosi]|uniref:DUF177 domain-containing protein n=1 Tax=Celeribacter arenosi TaxID=792649 RepID=A0ABP7KF29_9RHOB